ncbi:MAG: iron-containing alcohol dehydrogenase [Clostridia bacterium]|jgi:alcohol dehydrogenase|nr:iron-containing alcohol dehydrogenase [Candidatus Micrarchaeota archaeon]NLG04443.1 iron-containing alcohol dehydrogenase [Clostridia bacterium]
MSINEFFHRTKIVYGAGSVLKVGQEAVSLGAKKVLIVTDSFLSETSTMDKIKENLSKEKIEFEVYNEVKSNPRDVDCMKSAKMALDMEANVIIGIGGGSSMDQAKATAILVKNGGTCQDWEGVPLKNGMLPTICIPTTAGTGSEVTFVAVITDTKRKHKMSLWELGTIAAEVAIVDAELLISLPPSLTASTGVDALTHAIEAYTCKIGQPLTDVLALRAIELISKSIVTAVEQGDNIEARENMMLGSMMAGIAFGNADVGAVHAISETIGGWYDTPHGVGNSIFLPYVMEYNLPGNSKRYAEIARCLGVYTKGKTEEEIALEGISKIKELNKKVKIPTLKELEYISPDKFDEIAEASARNMLSENNARAIDKAGYMKVLKAAYENN